jgi:hypothetical protein
MVVALVGVSVVMTARMTIGVSEGTARARRVTQLLTVASHFEGLLRSPLVLQQSRALTANLQLDQCLKGEPCPNNPRETPPPLVIVSNGAFMTETAREVYFAAGDRGVVRCPNPALEGTADCPVSVAAYFRPLCAGPSCPPAVTQAAKYEVTARVTYREPAGFNMAPRVVSVEVPSASFGGELRCPDGTTMKGFDSRGMPICDTTEAVDCPNSPGCFLKGFQNGAPICKKITSVPQAPYTITVSGDGTTACCNNGDTLTGPPTGNGHNCTPGGGYIPTVRIEGPTCGVTGAQCPAGSRLYQFWDNGTGRNHWAEMSGNGCIAREGRNNRGGPGCCVNCWRNVAGPRVAPNCVTATIRMQPIGPFCTLAGGGTPSVQCPAGTRVAAVWDNGRGRNHSAGVCGNGCCGYEGRNNRGGPGCCVTCERIDGAGTPVNSLTPSCTATCQPSPSSGEADCD